jgi:uncharacterized phage protein (TIGR02218 family)
MKVISAPLKGHLAQEVTSLCSCWEVHRQDGIVLYFTDLDAPIPFGGQTYLPAVGYNKTAVENKSDMSVDNLDVVGLLDDDSITVEDLRAGLYNYAEIRVFVINWQDPAAGLLRLKRGTFGEVQILPNGTFRAELRGLAQALAQPVGDVTSPECRNDLGDAHCGININGDGWPRVGVVSDVAGEDLRAADDSWYVGGVLTWTSGANAGRNIEVKACDHTTHTVQLFLRMEADITLGDEFIIHPGCDKRRETCVNKFHNIVNMRAEPFKPGQDLLTQYPNLQA